MGRKCGYLALMSAIAGGAESALVPEIPYNLDNIINKIKKRYAEGKTRNVLILAEGVGSAYDFGKTLELMGGFEVRIIVLGHIQRGGSPTYFDRILASRMGDAAVNGLVEGKSSMMTALIGRNIELIPLSEVIGKKKPLDSTLLKMAEDLSI
jgi:6-phosphofructokinase 1